MSNPAFQTPSCAGVTAMLIWNLLPDFQIFPGYALGSHYPSVVVSFQLTGTREDRRLELLQRLQELDPRLSAAGSLADGLAALQPAESREASLGWLLRLCQTIQEAFGLAVFETGRILSLSQTQARCQIPVAALAQMAVFETLQALVSWLAHGEGNAAMTLEATVSERLAEALRALSGHAMAGSNSARFFRAAWERGVPTERLPGGVIQYGMGRRRRRLESSFTDATPNIGARIARNKAFTNAVFAQAGLPVPRQIMVKDAQAAVIAAARLGYPVVVKPADLDGGSGVAAGLGDAGEVSRAFLAARQLSDQVLVEQHVSGRDYRLTVFQGELIWAIERIAARVIGDGVHSVAQLIALENSNPLRGEGAAAPLKRLKLDAEAQAALVKQGLTAASVVAEGEAVSLRRAANVAAGGEPVAVYDQVHPDNARLAVRAARQLGLDLAGIDLLIPDISVSWLTPGNTPAICEINGQPNLGQITSPHLYGQILERLLENRGRIPSIVVLGAHEPAAWVQALSASLTQRGLKVGTAGVGGVDVGGEPLLSGTPALFRAGKCLLLDPDVDAMVVAITDSTWLSEGLPWARYDTLVLPGTSLPAVPTTPPQSVQLGLSQWVRALLPACDGLVFSVAEGSGAERLSAAQWHCVDQFDQQTLDKIVSMTLSLQHR